MPVYMIRAGQHGPVKIGYSDEVTLRLVKMQADNHERLQILRLFEGGEADEAVLHERFSDSRLHGEWFGFTKQMLGDVGLVEIIAVHEPAAILPDPPPVISVDHPTGLLGWRLRQARRMARMTQDEVASALGIARSTLASIEGGHDLPGRDLLLRLAPFFGTTLAALLSTEPIT